MSIFGKRASQIFTRPVYDAQAHLLRVQQLHAEYPLNTADKCNKFTAEIFIEAYDKHMPWLVVYEIETFLLHLFDANNIYCPDVPTSENREYLEIIERELSSRERIREARDAVVKFLKALPLPKSVSEKEKPSGPTVPLSVFVPNLTDHIENAIHLCMNTKYGEHRVFSSTAHDLTNIIYAISGMDPTKESSRQLKMPSEYDGNPTDYVQRTPFVHLFDAQVPFLIPRKTWAEHGALFAKSGHGKTQTLRAILAGFIQDPDPPALFIIDSLGSLIEGIADLEVFSTRLKDRLVILDPSDPKHTPSLNFFQLQSDDLCFYLFKAIDQSFTQRQATMIAYLMEYMRNVPDAGLLTLINVCESKENPYPDIMVKLSPFARSFFENQFYAKKPDTLVQQTKAQIAARIYTLARMPKFDQIFSSSKGVQFDPFRCMQEKKIVLINTDARPARLGGLDAASGIFGRFILALCLDAARGRPKNERHLALLVCDEAKAYMDEHAALILSDARQFGLGLLLATQFPHQLEEGVRREINTNTSVRFMGPVEYSVASQYARDMFTTPEFIMSMKSHDRSHTEWAAYVSNMTDRAVRLDVPFGTLEAMPKSTTSAPMSKETPQPGQPQTQSEKDHAAVDKMIAAVEEARTHEGPSKPAPQTAPTPSDGPVVKPGKPW